MPARSRDPQAWRTSSLVLDDRQRPIEVTLFEDVLQQYRALIERDAILVVDGALRWDEFIEDWRLTARSGSSISTGARADARRLVLRYPVPQWRRGHGRQRARAGAATEPRRSLRVGIRYDRADASAFVELGEEWTVRPSRELIERARTHSRPGRGSSSTTHRASTAESGTPRGCASTAPPAFSAAMPLSFLEFEQPIAELEAKIDELKFVSSDAEVNIGEEIARLRARTRAHDQYLC